MKRDGIDGTGHESLRHGTGWDSQRKIMRDGTGRDKGARDTGTRDTGLDGMTFWSSRGALIYSFMFMSDPHSR
ncbi:unnamed protein product [Sphagnum balticum]